jgi:hypothetical protein
MSVRASQAVIASLSVAGLAYTNASQIVTAAAVAPNPAARASQTVLGILSGDISHV